MIVNREVRQKDRYLTKQEVKAIDTLLEPLKPVLRKNVVGEDSGVDISTMKQKLQPAKDPFSDGNKTISSHIHIYPHTAKALGLDTSRRVTGKDGKIYGHQPAAGIRVVTPTDNGVGYSVLATHKSDSTIQSQNITTLNKSGIPILAIHDAVVANGSSLNDVSHGFNKNSLDGILAYNDINHLSTQLQNLPKTLEKIFSKYGAGEKVSADAVKQLLTTTRPIFNDRGAFEKYTTLDGVNIQENEMDLKSITTILEILSGDIELAKQDILNQNFLLMNVDGGTGNAYKSNVEAFNKANEIFKQEQSKATEVINTVNTIEGSKILNNSPIIGEPNRVQNIMTSTLNKEQGTLLDEHGSRENIFNELSNNTSVPLTEAQKNFLHRALDNLQDVKFKDLHLVIKDLMTAENYGLYQPNAEGLPHKIGIFPSKVGAMESHVQSPLEIYVHELYHAAIQYATLPENKSRLGTNKEVDQLFNIYSQARHNLDYTIFLNQDIDYAPTEKEIAYAKKVYNHIFSNNLSGFQEFLAYASTNEKFAKALSKIDTKHNPNDDLSIIEKIFAVVKNIFNAVFGKGNFTELFPKLSDVLLGKAIPSKETNLYLATKKLVNTVISANNKAMNNIESTDLSILTRCFEGVDYLRNFSNAKLSALISQFTQFSKNRNIPAPRVPDNPNSVQLAIYAIKIFFRVFTHPEARQKLGGAVSIMGKALGVPEGVNNTLSSVLSELTPDNDDSRAIIHALQKKANIDNQALTVKKNTKELIVDACGGTLSKEEDIALGDLLLRTDASSLLEYGYTSKDILDLYSNPNTLIGKENSAKKELQSLLKGNDATKSQRTIERLNTILANYMVTGESALFILYDPTTIVESTLKGKGYSTSTMKKITEVVDQLVTLQAMKMASSTTAVNQLKQISARSKGKGIEALLEVHKTQKEYTALVSDNKYRNVVKGGFKESFGGYYETHILRIADVEATKNREYRLLEDMGNGYGVYEHVYKPVASRTGNAFILDSRDTLNSVLEIFKDKSTSMHLSRENKLNNEVMHRADRNRKLLINSIQNDSDAVFSLDKVRQLSGGIGSANMYGNTQYIVTPNRETLISLGVDTSSTELLGNVASNLCVKQQALDHNLQLVDLLKKCSADFTSVLKSKDTILLGPQYQEYVEISPTSSSKFVRDNYNILPKNVRTLLENSGNTYVPKSLMSVVFGIKSMHLANNSALSLLPPQMKRIASMAEHIMKDIAGMSKIAIVVKTPSVVIQNLMGAVSYLVTSGFPISEVLSTYAKMWRYTKVYLIERKRFNMLSAKKLNKLASESEIAELDVLYQKLVNNPVHDGMKMGLYQAIVEDISEVENTTASKGYKKVADVLQDKSPIIYKTFQHLALAPGTPVFNFLYDVVQMSDFVGRMAGYHLTINKMQRQTKKNVPASKRAEVLQRISEDFVIYDLPQSRIEQYMDSIGLVMFIKFFKRIQSVIVRQAGARPLDVILALLFSDQVLDISHISESSALLTNRRFFTSLMDNVENVLDATAFGLVF